MSAIKFQSFAVEGSGPFPFDMLRYDTCYPDNHEDVVKILCSATQDKQSTGIYRISLARRVESKKDLPTYKRWESFGWRVLECQTR